MQVLQLKHTLNACPFLSLLPPSKFLPGPLPSPLTGPFPPLLLPGGPFYVEQAARSFSPFSCLSNGFLLYPVPWLMKPPRPDQPACPSHLCPLPPFHLYSCLFPERVTTILLPDIHCPSGLILRQAFSRHLDEQQPVLATHSHTIMFYFSTVPSPLQIDRAHLVTSCLSSCARR